VKKAKDKKKAAYDSDEEENTDARLETRFELKNIDIKIKKGDFVCIIGKDKSGKTTLVRTLLRQTICATDD